MNQSDIKAINELKILSIDMINGAKSGNPGIVLDMAPVMYTLFARVLNVYPKNPTFFNRDRVVLSSAHISPLYYSALHMAGFNVSKSDLEHFRRLDSNTPGLPELNNPLGVDASTGYAGDGIGISVGICMARRYLANMILNEDKKSKKDNNLEWTKEVKKVDKKLVLEKEDKTKSIKEVEKDLKKEIDKAKKELDKE